MSEPLHLHRQHPDSSPPPFDRVAIVGVGLIGGSIALAVRQRWPSVLLIGVDRRHVIERATVARAIDVGADDIGMIGDAELIVLAAPGGENERLLSGDIQRLVTRESTVTDVGSTKRGIMAAAKTLPAHLMFIGGHPIAGAAEGGFSHARADLFEGRHWILSAEPTRDPARLVRFVSGLGAKTSLMSAEEHDRLMAFVSHLPQLTVSALMTVVGEMAKERGLSLAGAGLRDSTRLATSPADIWRDVTTSNADEIGRALDALIQTLQQLRTDLNRGETLERVFRSAQDWKAKLEHS